MVYSMLIDDFVNINETRAQTRIRVDAMLAGELTEDKAGGLEIDDATGRAIITDEVRDSIIPIDEVEAEQNSSFWGDV